MDKRQIKFLERCPEVEKRFQPCLYTSFGDLCFYTDEWFCNNKCISKGDVCRNTKKEITGGILHTNRFNETINHLDAKEEDDTVCDWGLQKCGTDRCVSRYTPCHGKCWNDANPTLCGTNLCLNEFQIKACEYININISIL